MKHNTELKGYREPTQDEMDTMAEIRKIGQTLKGLVEKMEKNPSFDQRWVALSKTHLQEGIMAANRAVTKPDGF